MVGAVPVFVLLPVLLLARISLLPLGELPAGELDPSHDVGSPEVECIVHALLLVELYKAEALALASLRIFDDIGLVDLPELREERVEVVWG